MRTRYLLLMLLGVLVCSPGTGVIAEEAETAISDVLDRFHHAASEADGAGYFSFLADDAVFIGTDISERWSVDELKAFAEPYFSQGRGWTYIPGERHITVLPGGRTARFDEILANESYGACRGTGTFILTPAGWKISQYSLAIPIPNAVTGEIVARIKEYEEDQLNTEELPPR